MVASFQKSYNTPQKAFCQIFYRFFNEYKEKKLKNADLLLFLFEKNKYRYYVNYDIYENFNRNGGFSLCLTFYTLQWMQKARL